MTCRWVWGRSMWTTVTPNQLPKRRRRLSRDRWLLGTVGILVLYATPNSCRDRWLLGTVGMLVDSLYTTPGSRHDRHWLMGAIPTSAGGLVRASMVGVSLLGWVSPPGGGGLLGAITASACGGAVRVAMSKALPTRRRRRHRRPRWDMSPRGWLNVSPRGGLLGAIAASAGGVRAVSVDIALPRRRRRRHNRHRSTRRKSCRCADTHISRGVRHRTTCEWRSRN
jgi:hypothetical protein